MGPRVTGVGDAACGAGGGSVQGDRRAGTKGILGGGMWLGGARGSTGWDGTATMDKEVTGASLGSGGGPGGTQRLGSGEGRG